MKTRIFLFIIAAILPLASCNKWLDVELDNKVDESKLYESYDGFRESLAGVYSSMADSLMYGATMSFELLDVLAQYYSYGNLGSKYEYLKAYDYENATVKGQISAIWSRTYKCIAQANNILMWADRNASVLNQSQRNQIRGEAIALRAYLHFDLYRLFCPDAKQSPKADAIPYNKTFGVSIPPIYTVEEYVQLVINDLNEALTLLADDPIKNVVPYTLDKVTAADQYVARINYWAVKAMLARAYQARGDYDKAVATAKEVIESGKFRLLDFTSIDQDESMTDALFSDEHIFSLRNKKLDDICARLYRQINYSSGSYSPPVMYFSDAYTIYESNNDDARWSTWFNVGEYMKYFYNNEANFYRKVPMIKLSEMYLIIAECTYNTQEQTALQYLNELRNHRIRNHIALQYISRETVLNELRREYLGEGQMWYAFKRNNMNIPSSRPEGEFAASEEIYIFPMPMDEIEDGNRVVDKN